MSTNREVSNLLDQAWQARGKSNYSESKRLLTKAKKLCGPQDFDLLGRVFHICMQYEYDYDNLEEALAFNQKSISYYSKAGNSDRRAHALRHRADLQRALGLGDEAEANYDQVLEIYRNESNTSQGDLANALRGYALLLEGQNRFSEAIMIWTEIKSIYHNLDIPMGVSEASQKISQLENQN